jgi:hypothetical protein
LGRDDHCDRNNELGDAHSARTSPKAISMTERAGFSNRSTWPSDDPRGVPLHALCEQLEVNGVHLEGLSAADWEHLRLICTEDEEVQWKLFEAVAIAAEEFARTK